jgi:hypothetical protein
MKIRNLNYNKIIKKINILMYLCLPGTCSSDGGGERRVQDFGGET